MSCNIREGHWGLANILHRKQRLSGSTAIEFYQRKPTLAYRSGVLDCQMPLTARLATDHRPRLQRVMQPHEVTVIGRSGQP